MTPPKGPAERAAERITTTYRSLATCNAKDFIINIITAEYASIEQELALSQSTVRDRQSTFEFGADVMNKIILPRAGKMRPEETALSALLRWVAELTSIEQEKATLESELRNISEQLCGVKVGGEITLEMVYSFVEGTIDKHYERAESTKQENQALKSALSSDMCSEHKTPDPLGCDTCNKVKWLERHAAENQRLREALRKIAEADPAVFSDKLQSTTLGHWAQSYAYEALQAPLTRGGEK